jgi:hypothetical protein
MRADEEYHWDMSEYPTGRTALGDLTAEWLAKDPASPLNRAKRAAEAADDEEGLRLAKELAASMDQDRKQAHAARVLTTDEITKMLGAERTDTTPDANPPAVTLLTGPKSA